MKAILSKIMVFGASLLLFAIAGLQVFLGFAFGGRSGHQQRIYLAEEPTKFWTIVGLTFAFGLIAFLWGVLLVFWRGKKR